MQFSPPPRLCSVVLITVALAGCSASRPELLLETPAPAPAARKQAVEAALTRDVGRAFEGAPSFAAAEPTHAASAPVYLAAMPEVPWKSGRSYPSTSDALHPHHAPGPDAAELLGPSSAGSGVWSLAHPNQEEDPFLPYGPHVPPAPEPAPRADGHRPGDGRPYFSDGAADGIAGGFHTYEFESPVLHADEARVHGTRRRHDDTSDSELMLLIQKLRLELLQFELNDVPVKCEASLKGKNVVFNLKMKM